MHFFMILHDYFWQYHPWSQVPPDGEFSVMNYRMTQEFKPPFRINALIEEAGPLKVHKTLT